MMDDYLSSMNNRSKNQNIGNVKILTSSNLVRKQPNETVPEKPALVMKTGVKETNVSTSIQGANPDLPMLETSFVDKNDP